MDMEYRVSSGDLYKRGEYFFREGGDLHAYIKVHFRDEFPDVVHVIDTISARAFSHLSPASKTLLLENGYNPNREISKGVGMLALDSAILDMQLQSQQLRTVVIMALDRSRETLEKRIFSYFSPLPPHIKRVSGGGESAVATILLARDR